MALLRLLDSEPANGEGLGDGIPINSELSDGGVVIAFFDISLPSFGGGEGGLSGQMVVSESTDIIDDALPLRIRVSNSDGMSEGATDGGADTTDTTSASKSCKIFSVVSAGNPLTWPSTIARVDGGSA